jgi:hypothetical protein
MSPPLAAASKIIKLHPQLAPQKQEIAHQCDDPEARLLAHIVSASDCPIALEQHAKVAGM